MKETTLREAFIDIGNAENASRERHEELAPVVHEAYLLMAEKGATFVEAHDFLRDKGLTPGEILSAHGYICVAGADDDIDEEEDLKGVKLREAFKQMDHWINNTEDPLTGRAEEIHKIGLKAFIWMRDNEGAGHLGMYDMLKKQGLTDAEILSVFALVTVIGVQMTGEKVKRDEA